MRGGKRDGAGRKSGSRNKRTQATVEAAQAAGMLPHEFLCAIAQGQIIDGMTPTFEQRMDAAKAAAPYYAPKLANIEASGPDGGPMVLEIVRFGQDQDTE